MVVATPTDHKQNGANKFTKRLPVEINTIFKALLHVLKLLHATRHEAMAVKRFTLSLNEF